MHASSYHIRQHSFRVAKSSQPKSFFGIPITHFLYFLRYLNFYFHISAISGSNSFPLLDYNFLEGKTQSWLHNFFIRAQLRDCMLNWHGHIGSFLINLC